MYHTSGWSAWFSPGKCFLAKTTLPDFYVDQPSLLSNCTVARNLTKKTLGYLILLGVLLGILFGLFFVFIIPKTQAYLPSAPLPGMTHIAPSAPPSWLSVNYPTQNQIMSLAEYTTNQDGASSICIQVSPVRGDTKDPYSWTADEAVEKTIVLVDGIQRYKLPTTPVWDLMMVGGPYSYCVYAPVTPGIHKVDVGFKTSFGETLTFSWTFEVFAGAVPTPTALPTPVLVDHEKHLPLLLRTVYPTPGQVVSLKNYVSLDPEDEKIWTWEGRSKDFLEKMKGSVCLAFRQSSVDALGSLDWPTRAYLQIDGNILDNWRGPNMSFSIGTERLAASCPKVSLGVGKHIVSIYLHPYNAGLTSYSWEFTITK